MTFVPLCMDAAELQAWTQGNAALPGSHRATRPCADCQPSFATEQRAIGRCNGEPGAADVDEPLVSTARRVNVVQPIEPRVEQPSYRAVEVAVTVPCGTCAKADVCNLRPLADAMRHARVQLPAATSPRLGLELAGSVSCAAYLRAPRRAAEPTEATQLTEARRLNLSDEERERRARQARLMSEANAARRAAEAQA